MIDKIKNPNSAEVLEHLPPEQLVKDIMEKEQQIMEIMGEIKQVLDGGIQCKEINEEQIYEKYESVAVKWGAELLFRHSDALRFIDDCERLGLTILGLDFYEDVGDTIIRLLNSADYSSLSKTPDAVRKSTSVARELIKHGFPDRATWASFVVEE